MTRTRKEKTSQTKKFFFLEISTVAELLRVRTGRLIDALTQPTIKVGEKTIRKNQNLKKVKIGKKYVRRKLRDDCERLAILTVL